jgi:acetyl esterase/lipase
MRRVLICALTACVAGCAKPYDVQQLSYDQSIGYLGTFDFYEPKADPGTSRPAILAIHGGGWRGGDKPWGAQFAKELCPDGYVVFSINYRLAGRPRSPAHERRCIAFWLARFVRESSPPSAANSAARFRPWRRTQFLSAEPVP